MADTSRTIERRIARLREAMRDTLDRTRLPAMRAELMVELEKLITLKNRGEP